MNEFFAYLKSMHEGAVIIRLVLATFCGSLIGWERELKHHSAGVKTFTLVSLGSAVATILNIYLSSMPGYNADLSRIPAGIVSGIGFLGAGTIMVTGRNQIKGLTTAATLWVTASMGMAIGSGAIILGLTCFCLELIANVVLLRFTNAIENNSRYMSVYMEIWKNQGAKKLMTELGEMGITVTSVKKVREKTLLNTDTAVMMDIDLKGRRMHQDIVNLLDELEYVDYVEEM